MELAAAIKKAEKVTKSKMVKKGNSFTFKYKNHSVEFINTNYGVACFYTIKHEGGVFHNNLTQALKYVASC